MKNVMWPAGQQVTWLRAAYLLLLVPGEGDVELRQDFGLLGFLQLLLVEIILVLMSAAEEHHRLSHLLPYTHRGGRMSARYHMSSSDQTSDLCSE